MAKDKGHFFEELNLHCSDFETHKSPAMAAYAALCDFYKRKGDPLKGARKSQTYRECKDHFRDYLWHRR